MCINAHVIGQNQQSCLGSSPGLQVLLELFMRLTSCLSVYVRHELIRLQGAVRHHVRRARAAGVGCAAAAGRRRPGQPAGARQLVGHGGSQVRLRVSLGYIIRLAPSRALAVEGPRGVVVKSLKA